MKKHYTRTATAAVILAATIAVAAVAETRIAGMGQAEARAEAPAGTAYEAVLVRDFNTGSLPGADTPATDYASLEEYAKDHPEETVLPDPHPFTDEEVTILAQVMQSESQICYWNGTKYGVSYKARQAAVAWCALNRYDAGTWGDTLKEVLTRPKQFAYHQDVEPSEEMLTLAEDIIARWAIEKTGTENVGRTLPADYYYFEGDGRENHFRKTYEKTGQTWDWTLPDPYQE